jgi:O-acetyl-ADP-ribose deacetylase (regulator of RNase III)
MKTIEKDICEGFKNKEVDVIAHCCNCFCTMGSGVAKAIRASFPVVYEADLQTRKGDREKLGTYSVAKVDDRYIVNLYAQFTYGRNTRELYYDAMISCLEKLKSFMLRHDFKSVGFPKGMGCILAGGDWRIVDAMVQSVFDGSGIEVCYYQYSPPPTV